MWILTNPHHFLTLYTWDVLRVNANRMKQLSNIFQRCLNHVFLLEQQIIIGVATTSRTSSSMESDTVNLHTRKWSNFKKFQALAWMIINSSRKNSNQLENCRKYALRLSKNAHIWHVLEDFTSLRLVNKFARSITKWTQACDRRLARLLHSSRITRHSIADWVCVKTLTLLLRTQINLRNFCLARLHRV